MPKRESQQLTPTIIHIAYKIAKQSREESNERMKTDINTERSCATKLNKEHKIVTAKKVITEAIEGITLLETLNSKQTSIGVRRCIIS